MKKSVVSTCAAMLLSVTASTSFAAANPFEDVPAGHWAYDAVAQLAADGVIEGYGDGSYRGDQEITRFEMAQMVARAMAKKTSGYDKAMLDKLAAEFADELNSLGVRVTALEKRIDNVKWNGTVRYRYSYNNVKDEDNEKNIAQYVTLRLEPSMQINEHWSGHARIDFNTDMDSAANATGANRIMVNGRDEIPTLSVERVWAQGDYKNLQILLGKLPYITNVDNGMVFDDNVSGGQITYGNKIKGTLTIGRSSRFDAVGANPNALPPVVTGSYQAIEIYNDRADKITWGIGFHRWSNRNHLLTETSAKGINIFDVGLGYKFDKNFSIHGAYSWTPSPKGEPAQGADPAEPATASSKRAWTVELDYKKANPTDKGSWGAFLAYRKLGHYAVIAPTYDAAGPGYKGVEFGADYVFEKNIMGTLKCFLGKEFQDEADSNDAMLSSAYTIFGELNYFF